MTSHRRLCSALAAAALLLAGCGDDEATTEDTTTDSTAAAEVTSAPTPEPTPTPTVDPDCDVGPFVIQISGGTGISCKNAAKIYKTFAADRELPAGWKCELQACTKVEDDGTVRDFVWREKR